MSVSTSVSESVLAEQRGAVLVLTLNRPDRLNAWTDELEDRYFELLDGAEADLKVRAVVLTGAGRGFCAGADMELLEGISSASAAPTGRTRTRTRPLSFRKPLIAAINGAAAGLGLVEALYCDVRFAAPEAKLTTAFVRRGLIAEYGSAWLLPRIVGIGRATDLLVSGRVVLGAEAHEFGLVDFVESPEGLVDAAVAYAADLAENCSPASMVIIKEQLRRALDQSLDEALEEAGTQMRDSFSRPDVKEGVASYLERRLPRFEPLGD
jgi:enoyl-CoA hydratase/carnithine racemase